MTTINQLLLEIDEDLTGRTAPATSQLHRVVDAHTMMDEGVLYLSDSGYTRIYWAWDTDKKLHLVDVPISRQVEIRLIWERIKPKREQLEWLLATDI